MLTKETAMTIDRLILILTEIVAGLGLIAFITCGWLILAGLAG
jgi:hypothetical protein